MKTKMDAPIDVLIPTAGIKPDGTKYNIMIVDDSIFVVKQLTQILQSQGYEIIATAVDGQDALEKYQMLHPKIDLVTMDITMPRMDGLTALEKIIAFDKNARVVMISALGKEELVKQSLLTGAKNYIVKPLVREKVLDRIANVLSK